MRASAYDLLREFGISLRDTREGEHTTTCPRCSADRKPSNRRKPCLSVKVDSDGIVFCCHHCGWSGGKYYEGGTRGDRPKPKASAGSYGKLQQQVKSDWR